MFVPVVQGASLKDHLNIQKDLFTFHLLKYHVQCKYFLKKKVMMQVKPLQSLPTHGEEAKNY